MPPGVSDRLGHRVGRGLPLLGLRGNSGSPNPRLQVDIVIACLSETVSEKSARSRLTGMTYSPSLYGLSFSHLGWNSRRSCIRISRFDAVDTAEGALS